MTRHTTAAAIIISVVVYAAVLCALVALGVGAWL